MALIDYAVQQEIRILEDAEYDAMVKGLKLKEWGRWMRDGNRAASIGYPGCTIEYSGDPWQEKTFRELVGTIDDEEAIRISAAVRRLPPRHRSIIEAIYIRLMTELDIRRVMLISERQTRYYQHQALGMLWAMLK